MTTLGKTLWMVGIVAIASCTKPVEPSQVLICPPKTVVWVMCSNDPDATNACRVRDGAIGCGLDRLAIDYANERMARRPERAGRFTLFAVEVTAEGAGPADQRMAPESSYRPEDQ